MHEDKAIACPFCGWVNQAGEYEMLLHMETLHAEGDSPARVRAGQTSDDVDTAADPPYAECPVDGCGELLALEELDYHLELHAEQSSEHLREATAPTPYPNVQTGPQFAGPLRPIHVAEKPDRPDQASEESHPQAKAISAWRRLLKMPRSSSANGLLHFGRLHDGKKKLISPYAIRGIRLGKAQLGKYAHEERMPDWLVTMLRKHGQVSADGVIPVLVQLLEQCSATKYAYLCHPCVQHVSKIKREGGFCGYRNIQMMSSFIIGTQTKGHRHFKGELPSIFQIQEDIETAWDRGINAEGRVETGGIRGTRKYIGTPEALAVFCLLEVPCEPLAIKDPDPAKCEARLMAFVENYFQSAVEDPTQRIRQTKLPPLYFQHAGHSLTIIGFEQLKNGSKHLLVFDPSFHDSSAVTRLIGKTFVHPMSDMPLKQYRRGTRYLKAYREFELLRLRVEAGGP